MAEKIILPKKPLVMLTAYDCAFGRILDEAGVDIILVGDSLGNVILGYENTLPVTMEDMVHHTRAVGRGVKRALLVADMPFQSSAIPRNALENAMRLVEAGAGAVKIEGVDDIEGIRAIVEAGIPVMGHLGFLPQKMGTPAIQRSPQIIDQAKQLEQAGVFALVLEMVSAELAKQVTETVKIPTIGIGAGPHTDGQVLVTHDMLGLYPNPPKFAKKYLDLEREIKEAVGKFIAEAGPHSSTDRATAS